MTRSKEFGQDTVQQFNLSRCPDEFVINESTGTDLILYAFEQEGMLADLAQLHQFVTETFYTTRFSLERHRIEQVDNDNSAITTYPLESFPSAIILCFFICL